MMNKASTCKCFKKLVQQKDDKIFHKCFCASETIQRYSTDYMKWTLMVRKIKIMKDITYIIFTSKVHINLLITFK